MTTSIKKYEIHNDDMMNVLSRLQSNSVDLIVTDPAYKIAKKRIEEVVESRGIYE